MQDVLQDCESK